MLRRVSHVTIAETTDPAVFTFVFLIKAVYFPMFLIK